MSDMANTSLASLRYSIRRLRDRKKIGSHSEIGRQYVLLQKLGVGLVRRAKIYSDRYDFHLLDTPENMRALDMAIEYLTVHEVVKRVSKEAEARQLLLPGIYGSPTKTRMDLRTVKETQMSPSSMDKLYHLIIGGSSGID